MSTAEWGREAASRASGRTAGTRIAGTWIAVTAGNNAGGRGRARRARTRARHAPALALCVIAPAALVYGALQLAMHWMGPPPFATVAHLMPSTAPGAHDARAGSAPLRPDDVDPRYLAMLFAFEDRRFYSHFGVDPVGLARALRDLVLHQRIVTGGSTLTMQVARLLDNQYRRTPAVKLRQIVRAIQLEGRLSKHEILGLYLGMAPFGGRLKGVRAAALHHFGKEPRRLSIAEAALLVALPQAPEARRLDRHPAAALRARNFVIETVAAAGVLTPAEAERAKLEPLTGESLKMPPAPTPKPPPAHVASLLAGITLGINLVASPAAAAPMEPDPLLQSADALVLDVRRKLTAPPAAETSAGEREALWMFYAARREPLWVSRSGWTPRAQAAIDELQRADDWGLDASAFAIPPLPAETAGAEGLPQEELVDAEIGLSLAVLQYARHARGGRIENPTEQLSSYLDRKPTLVPPFLVMSDIAAAQAPDAYLRSLNPQHPQFERLRQEYLARRDRGERQVVTIPKGSSLKPGARDEDIRLVRERLGVAVPPEGDIFYDDKLAAAVKRFQEKRGIEPANGTINSKTRRAFNERRDVSLATLLANMEQWRWMPADLGESYVWVNIPDFTVRVVRDGEVVHAERVITGELGTQTPIFSKDLETIYFHPRWNVPESIKLNEIMPAIARGRRGDMVVTLNGKVVNRSKINWSKVRNYDIYQPSGPGNALGIVKFTFPNKHAVYLHDTPSKGLFGSSQRTFSHGCVRVRNPQRLAEVLLDIDKGWTPEDVARLIKVKGTPEENPVALDKHIPVHLTYFTAQVDEDGDLATGKDVYGHEKRITQALQGKWNSIDKGADHLAQVELNRRLEDTARSTRSRSARRASSGRRVATTRSSGSGGGFATRVSSGSSANDIFRRSFGN